MSTKTRNADEELPPVMCNCSVSRYRHRARKGVCEFDCLELPIGSLVFDEATGETSVWTGPRKSNEKGALQRDK